MHVSLPFLNKANTAKFTDRGIKKAGELIQAWQGNSVKGIGLIGAPLSKTSISHSGAAMAPDAVRAMFHSFTTYSIEQSQDLWERSITDFGDVLMHVTDLQESQRRIEETIYSVIQENPQMVPVILGGDHSISARSIAAIQRVKGKVGVIQFDAHFDLRNLEDGGPSNGTPFRQLLEKSILDGSRLVQIGIRDFANGKQYHDYAKDQGIHVYSMGNVKHQGIIAVLEESVEKLKRECDVLYVSVDMDVLDQAFAPGCPAIGPGGMDSSMLIEAIQWLAKNADPIAIDFVEMDPTLDFRNMTSRLAAYLILQFMTHYTFSA